MRAALLLSCIFLIAVSLVPANALAQVDSQRFNQVQCDHPDLPPIVLQRIRCGTLVVPRIPDDHTGGTFTLPVTIVQPTLAAKDDPIIIFPGGPGSSAYLGSIPAVMSGFFDDRQVILMEQRGTLEVDPVICRDTMMFDGQILGPNMELDAMLQIAWQNMHHCLVEAEEAGLNPQQFGSRVEVHDVEALRRALGIERWNILGISYGTVLAIEYARAYPAAIRAMIIDSPVAGPNEPMGMQAKWARAMHMLEAACASDPACYRQSPDLGDRVETLLARLADQPITMPIAESFRAPENQLTLNAGDMHFVLFAWLYDHRMVSNIPSFIQQLEMGETAAFSQGMAMATAQRPMSTFSFAATHCRDGFAERETQQFLQDRPLNGVMILTMRADDCGAWAADENSRTGGLLTTEVPALIFSGGSDPMTPPANAHYIARAIVPFARLLEFPNVGHATFGQSQCAARLLIQFLNDPSQSLQDNCIGSEPPIAFVPLQQSAATN